MIFLLTSDHSTMSGLRLVWTTSGKTSFFLRSAFISHDAAWWRIPSCPPCVPVFVCPAFTNCIECCFPQLPSSTYALSQGCLPRLLEPGHVASGTSPAEELSYTLTVCAMVPRPPHKWHDGSSVRPQVCRFAGDGSVSYTNRSKKEILAGSSFHSSGQDTWRSSRFHLVHAPCLANSTVLSFFISVPPPFSLIQEPYLSSLYPEPCSISWTETFQFPMQVFPMTSLSWSELSDSATAAPADHFLPDPVTTPASLTFASAESLSVKTSLHLATLNSSTTDDRGSCSWHDLLYRPIEQKLCGTPSHLLSFWLTFFSSASTMDMVIS